ncbi:MAG: TetR/AcrR family transcriptional regulator [Sphingomonadales bacterium]|nr:TetR/AcrR family transcriptional regulator [Sphingomonadales bacterium]
MGQKGEAKKAKIINAANDLFYKQGFGATSFADIAKASGLPKGNFYFYFPTKDSLLDAVLEARIQGLKDKLTSFEDEFTTPKERLLRMAEMPFKDFDDITRYGCPMGSLGSELGKCNVELNASTVEMFDVIMDWATAQLCEAGASKDNAQHTARHMLITLQGAALMAYTYGDPIWLKDAVDHVKATINAC